MSRSFHGRVEVELSDFESKDILDAALEIIDSHIKQGAPKPTDYWRHGYKENEELIQKIITLLRAQPDPEPREDLPPPSTAARVRSLEELRAELLQHNTRLKDPRDMARLAAKGGGG